MAERITQGSVYEEHFSFTQEQVNQFAEVSGDKNPIHIDAQYAAQTVFKKPVIHGFLGGSVFSRVLGTRFPGEGTIYMRQDMAFRRPMFVDQRYKAHFEILEHHADKHRALIATVVEDAEGKPVITGEALVQNDRVL